MFQIFRELNFYFAHHQGKNMALPYFFQENLPVTGDFTLDEAASKHIIQVLRMGLGEKLQLTDGRGTLVTAEIVDDHRKKCVVRIIAHEQTERPSPRNTIAMALLKNAGRYEWFLEKATEMGTSAIIPLITSRTEKQHFRSERMKGILIAAMLQSQKTWLPELPEPVPFAKAITQIKGQKLIAHCEEGEKIELKHMEIGEDTTIFIGPEGDFTPDEIKLALNAGFKPVSLGPHRLRTETAGIYAAAMFM